MLVDMVVCFCAVRWYVERGNDILLVVLQNSVILIVSICTGEGDTDSLLFLGLIWYDCDSTTVVLLQLWSELYALVCHALQLSKVSAFRMYWIILITECVLDGEAAML